MIKVRYLNRGTQIDCKVGLTVKRIHLKNSFIYKYKKSTLTLL